MAFSARARLNSAGVDLSDPLVRDQVMEKLAKLEAKHWSAVPTGGGQGETVAIVSPFDTSLVVGDATWASEGDVDRMVRAAHASQIDWDQLGGAERARLLDRAADLFEQHREELFSLCIREAGENFGRRGA